MSFDDFETFAFALEDGSRYKLKIKLLVKALRIAVMTCCENYVWADEASRAVAYKFLVLKYDDSHGRIGILIYLQNFRRSLVLQVLHVFGLGTHDSVVHIYVLLDFLVEGACIRTFLFDGFFV